MLIIDQRLEAALAVANAVAAAMAAATPEKPYACVLVPVAVSVTARPGLEHVTTAV